MRTPIRASLRLPIALTLVVVVGGLLGAAPAVGGDVPEPPPVGSCHDLTYAEAYKRSDPKAPVDCTEPHTTVTVKVVQLDAPMDLSAIPTSAFVGCYRATRLALGDRPEAQAMSSYETWFFIPTKAEREAGAAWLRCDLVLRGGTHVEPLPTDGTPFLTGLPLDRDIARCLVEDGDLMINTVCRRRHVLKAEVALKNRGSDYPGSKEIEASTAKKCSKRLGQQLGWYHWPTRTGWRAGYPYSVCHKKHNGRVLASTPVTSAPRQSVSAPRVQIGRSG